MYETKGVTSTKIKYAIVNLCHNNVRCNHLKINNDTGDTIRTRSVVGGAQRV